MEILRVERGEDEKMEEFIDLIDGDVLVERKIEKRIEKNREVEGGKKEKVEVRKVRVFRVVREEKGIKSSRYIG